MCYDEITCKECGKIFPLKKIEYRNSSDRIQSDGECPNCVKEATKKVKSDTTKKRGRKSGPVSDEEKKERENKRFYRDLEQATENVEAEIRRSI